MVRRKHTKHNGKVERRASVRGEIRKTLPLPAPKIDKWPDPFLGIDIDSLLKQEDREIADLAVWEAIILAEIGNMTES